MGHIAIVGNDYPNKICTASSFVDSCEIVVRFNRTPYYRTGLVGSKTDILVIRAGNSSKGQETRTGVYPLVPEVCQRAKEYWFIGTEGQEQCKELYNLEGKFITMENSSTYARLGSPPSTGIVAIDYILSNNLYAEHKKYLVAAGWTKLNKTDPNSKSHNWDKEIKYVQNHIRMGNLKKWKPYLCLKL